jgi:hypothetical protein
MQAATSNQMSLARYLVRVAFNRRSVAGMEDRDISKSRLETDRVTSTGRAAMSGDPTEGGEALSAISGSGPSAKATLAITL